MRHSPVLLLLYNNGDLAGKRFIYRDIKTALPAGDEAIALVRLNIQEARPKRFLENVDYDILLR